MTAAKKADKRLFWNADHTKLVDENDPEARSLAAAVGDDVPEVVVVKQAAKAEDKSARPDSNK